MEESTMRKGWIKNAIIVFLVIMLLLTFFSNTITNYTLPQVSTSYVQSGSITDAIRGTGNIEVADAYEMIAGEARTIASCAVSKGDHVEKGDVIYYLEESSSEELTKAENELSDLEFKYITGLLTSKMTPSEAIKVYENGANSFNYYITKMQAMDNQIKAAEAEVDAIQEAINGNNLDAKKQAAAAVGALDPYKLEVELASKAKDDAQAAFETAKARIVANLTAQKAELEAKKSTMGTKPTNEQEYLGQIRTPLITIIEALTESGQTDLPSIAGMESFAELETDYTVLKIAIAKSKGKVNPTPADAYEYDEYKTLLQDADAAISAYKSGVKNNEDSTTQLEEDIRNLEKQITDANNMSYTNDESYKRAIEHYMQATQNVTSATTYLEKQTANAAVQLESNTNALNIAKTKLDLLKADYDTLVNDITKALEAEKTSEEIARKQEEIEKLQEKTMGSEVVAQVAGTIQELPYVAGQKTEIDKCMAKIIPDGKDMTLSISVSKANAAKVKVGATAELVNNWYYDDIHMVLTSITDDETSGGTNKKLNFTVSGSNLTVGESLNISVDSKTTDYQCIVPKSAYRSDNSGGFVYVLVEKSSPLGTRYFAEKRQVTKEAEDDKSIAVSGDVAQYEYVITDSNKPVEAGKQVRLSVSAN